MKEFKTLLKESILDGARKKSIYESAEDKNYIDDIKVLENIHKRFFPDSYANVDVSMLTGKPRYFFESTIYASYQWKNGIIENDPMNTLFVIDSLGNGQFKTKLLKGSKLYLNPVVGSVNSFETVDVNFTVFVGTLKDVIIKINEWETRRADVVKEYKSRLPLANTL